MTMGLSLSKFEGTTPKKHGSTLYSFFGRKPDAAKQTDCKCAEQEEATCSGSKLQFSGADVISIKQNATPTVLPIPVPVMSATQEASGDQNMESLSNQAGSSTLQPGLGGPGLISVSGMLTKQKACLHSEFHAETESYTDVKVGGDTSQLLDAAGMNQAVFDSLPSDIQGEIIHDLSVRFTHSADEVGVSSLVPHPCEVCGIPVPQNEVQVHADYHVAEQLSAALQGEGRSQAAGVGSKEAFNCTQTASSRKRSSSGQCNSLSKYFKPSVD